MTDMTPLYSLFALIPLLISAFILYAHERTYGILDITTTATAYDRTRYGRVLDWDKYALSIEGDPVMLFSGEFHYWRVPDRERWAPILKQYRSMGLNTIRIYFHWGYHSPKEGVYKFDGNRDIDYLLELCEELGLYVLAAPGPYICAETQAGGYPAWLIAKRDLYIRHNQFMLWRTYDSNFAAYEVQWLNHILPILAKHQITENRDKKGCVLALQIDNELFQTLFKVLPIGLHDQMRVLAKAARDAGITVPLFTNDGFEEGGWIPRPESDKMHDRFWSRKKFGIDLYGFDKYVVFAPSSSPKSWVIDSGTSTAQWEEWNPREMENSIDVLEKKVRGYGGGAKDSPMFIPELQGGWFNHYLLSHTYDDINDFYGDQYTKLLVESTLAQGVSIASIYMIYGGTNWGSIGDPDVYTSYDYSACIREYGFMSSRGRNLRETVLFARSFDPYFTKTDRVAKPNITSSVPHTMNLQRVAVDSDQPVKFTFFRNFDSKKRDMFQVTVNTQGYLFNMQCYLPYKTSFIAVGSYNVANGLHLLMSTIPIHMRMVNKETNDEVWIIEPNTVGSMAFEHKEMQITGNMQNDVLRREGPATIVSFEKRDGWSKLSTSSGNLYIIGLTKEDIGTLYADFEEAYWNNGRKQYPSFIAWGADTMFFDRHQKKLEINYRRSDSRVYMVSFTPPSKESSFSTVKTGVYTLPLAYSFELRQHAHRQYPLPISITLSHWQSRSVQFPSLPWHPLKTLPGKSVPTFDALDYLYVSDHVLYRTTFQTPVNENPRVRLILNMRHRATVLLNGRIVGGHITYSRQLFMPGGKVGPDPWFLGTETYDLSPYLSHEGRLQNDLVVVVESFGLNRQAFIMNDVRNPRGIIKAKLRGLDKEESKRASESWQITGVDVQQLWNPFNSTGFPDETEERSWEQLKTVEQDKYTYQVPLTVSQGVQWLQFRFDCAYKASNAYNVPLRLHLDGQWTAHLFLNDVFIARYYGNGDGPQHDFYLPDGLIRERDNKVRMLVYTWKDTQGAVTISGWPVHAVNGNLITHATNVQDKQEYMVWKEQVRM
ncbi:hypothetical protein EC973_006234 [Apophysomyces ossiformis]|uniref:beta-galactosidase n=1 Tax=Apophysomyces ossiformis TaxID=679940 RepID=A0A8H7EP40_9FUNG|nr:hypothetical protein EC973_006234 [Apophysomyces ossiformis]